MADTEKDAIQGESTVEQSSNVKALEKQLAELTKQLESLTKQNEELKKTQSGQDRTNTDLQKKLADAEKALVDKDKTWQEKLESQVTSLTEKITEGEKARRRAELKAYAIEKGKNIPEDLMQFVYADSEKEIESKIGSLSEALGKHAQSVKDGVLKESARKPQLSEKETERFFSIDQINGMSPGEFEKNREKVLESIKYHQQTERG
jgi:predicted RNase H-like nuclease (RuvC/YqgF family)